jgi:hypothetical protein
LCDLEMPPPPRKKKYFRGSSFFIFVYKIAHLLEEDFSLPGSVRIRNFYHSDLNFNP